MGSNLFDLIDSSIKLHSFFIIFAPCVRMIGTSLMAANENIDIFLFNLNACSDDTRL
jgi:hypothetical protein